jgi:hypothetical protein
MNFFKKLFTDADRSWHRGRDPCRPDGPHDIHIPQGRMHYFFTDDCIMSSFIGQQMPIR